MRRLMNLAAGALTVAAMCVAVSGTADAAQDAHGFAAVDRTGLMSAWWADNQYQGYFSAPLGAPWNGARLITTLRGGGTPDTNYWTVLVVADNGNAYLEHNDHNWSYVGPGWGDARLIAGLDETDFVEVHDSGELTRWYVDWQTHQWTPQHVGQGWSDARLLAGLGQYEFAEVTYDGRLMSWYGSNGGATWTGSQSGQNWNNARAIAGVDTDHFVEITDGGDLQSWAFSGSVGTFVGHQVGPGWAGTLIG